MKWRRLLVGLAIVGPLIALFAFGLTTDPRRVPTPLAGMEAPDFELEVMALDDDAEGEVPEVVSLAEHRGQIVVVNFWASWCLPCRDEHVPLSRMADAYRDRGVAFFGILYNDSPGNARRWIAEMGGQSYPALVDPRSRTAIDYGVYGVPETYFIGRDGRIAYKVTGPVTERALIERLEAILAADETDEEAA